MIKPSDLSYQHGINISTNNGAPQNNTIIPDTPSQDQIKFYTQHGFYIKDGCYCVVKKKSTHEDRVSNFVMNFLYHMNDGTNNTKRMIMLQHKNSDVTYIEAYSGDLKKEPLETILKSKGCTFYGNTHTLQKIFEYLMAQEQQAIMLDNIGWCDEHHVYAFADSIYHLGKTYKSDDFGVASIGEKKFYLPACGFVNKTNEDYKALRLYDYKEGIVGFRHWAELFFRAYKKNAAMGIVFAGASIFRDIVFDRTAFFPYLFLFGQPGTGKTSFAETILSLFGKDTLGTPLNNSTTTGLSRTVSQRKNGVFYLKEYTSETDNRVQDFILTAYDGSGRTTGIKSQDNRTKTNAPKSGIIFDGNNLPAQKCAILSRMILLDFETSRFDEDQTHAFNQLKDYAMQGFGKVLLEILNQRPLVKKNFSEVYQKTARDITMEMKAHKDQGPRLDQRLINHMAVLISIYKILSNVLDFPFTLSEFENHIKENALNHNQMLIDNDVQRIWWEAFAYIIKKDQIAQYADLYPRGAFRTKQIDSGTCILQIKINDIWPHYMRYCRENNIVSHDKSSIRNILTSKGNPCFHQSTQKSRKQSYTDATFGSCHQFLLDTENGTKTIYGVELPL